MAVDGSVDSADRLVGAVRPVTGAVGDYDGLLDLIGDRRLVLIGEASHGTHEFYRERARITRRLIDECGFTVVAVEGDWPDAYRVNRYVMGISDDAMPSRTRGASAAFRPGCGGTGTSCTSSSGCGPAMTPRSTRRRKVRFYGLDLYSLRTSIEAVIGYLDGVDPAEAARARAAVLVLRSCRRRWPGLRVRRHNPGCGTLRERGRSPSWWSCGGGPARTCGGTAGWPRTSSSTPNRTRAWCATPRSTTTRCTGPRCRRGTSGTGTWPARSTP